MKYLTYLFVFVLLSFSSIPTYEKSDLLGKFSPETHKKFSRVSAAYCDRDIYLRKDDVLHVSESDTDQAYAFGEFTTSGPISVYKDLTLTELLATKGINKATAKTKNIYILREDLTKYLHVDIYTINLNNPAAFIAANNFHILPNDIVFIPQTNLVKWNNVISLLTPSETLFKTYKPYIAEQDDWYIRSADYN